ncbi:hypothetical protein E2542_SST03062 [Spatholobus suberectus]|nr:hypothetical protein E2542_SST03062 [Spatholobus suberectus]
MERMNSAGSSIRRRSLSISSHISHHTDNDGECESVSEAGDIGDRALPSRRLSESNSLRLSFEIRSENEAIVSIPEENRFNSSVRPLPPPFTSTYLPTDAIVGSEDTKQDPRTGLPELLDYASCMVHLAVFGILGVLTRYLLQKLFGPGVAHVTSDQTILYVDLPSNMVCPLFHLHYFCVLVTYRLWCVHKTNTPELFCQEHNFQILW